MTSIKAISLPRYDRTRPYRWNYDNAPKVVPHVEPCPVPGTWTFCEKPIGSPLGMPAGPLLNGQWILYYAALGFDVLTYKTVRSIARDCYSMPNLQPVLSGQLTGEESELISKDEMTGTWAVSFGMPSMSPNHWREDVEHTRKHLPSDKLLSVSVVGSVQPDWSLSELASDYATCAKWAIESGADAVEANFSCPNVSTCDGQLYQQPKDAAIVAQHVREAVGNAPYVIKIGRLNDVAQAEQLLDAVAPFADALAMTNSLATRVRTPDGVYLFDREYRGICGDATRTASLEQTRMLAQLIRRKGLRIRLIGVGGVNTSEHVRAYLEAGAEMIHIATAAMISPSIALDIRRDLADAGQ